MITTYEARGIKKGEEKGRLEGRLEGERKGKLEGERKGKQKYLILQLEHKFGKLSAAKRRQIQKIETAQELDSLLRAVLDAQSLKDLPW